MAVDISSDFYFNIYGGTEYEDIDRLLRRAANEIDSVILRSPEGELEERQYSFAVCAQAEYMGLCGGVEAWAASVSGNLSSVSIGSFSMSQSGSGAASGGAAAVGICSRAMEYLSKSGLLYRGCAAW